MSVPRPHGQLMVALGSVAAEARMPFLLQAEKWSEGRARSHGPTASSQAGLPLPSLACWVLAILELGFYDALLLDLGKGIPISDRGLRSAQPPGSRPCMPLRPLW